MSLLSSSSFRLTFCKTVKGHVSILKGLSPSLLRSPSWTLGPCLGPAALPTSL